MNDLDELSEIYNFSLTEDLLDNIPDPGTGFYDLSTEFQKLLKSDLAYEFEQYRTNYQSTAFVIPYKIITQLDIFCSDDLFAQNILQNLDRLRSIISTELTVPIHDIVIGFSEIPSSLKTTISKISNKNINKFVCFEAIVRKSESMQPKIETAYYFCKTCGFRHNSPYGKINNIIFEPQDPCPNCNKKTWTRDHARCSFQDVQRIYMQDTAEDIRPGSQPASIQVDLYHPHINSATPGTRAIISGIVRPEQIKGTADDPKFDLVIETLNIEFPETDYTEIELSESDIETIKEIAKNPEIYSIIRDSIAPTIFGMEEVKTALSLVLFSGVTLTTSSIRKRGDIHIFLIGDPGVAKSQLLDHVAHIAPRCIQTSGKGSSTAGLTATAVQSDSGKWSLEAGALPMADKGICVIDELDKMRDSDRDSLHRAMEQQEIPIAKAGILATLQSRCGVIAAANPKHGRFDDYEPLATQIDLDPALLSRFDLIFVLKDRPNAVMDTNIANHILKLHDAEKNNPKALDPVFLKKYISYAKTHVFPVITQESKDAIIEFYLKLRKQSSDTKAVGITARTLEAILRIGQASARIRLSDTVTLDDAKRAIKLMDTCMRDVAFDHSTGQYDVDNITSKVGTKSRQEKAVIIITKLKAATERDGGAVSITNFEKEILETTPITQTEFTSILASLEKTNDVMYPRNGFIRNV